MKLQVTCGLKSLTLRPFDRLSAGSSDLIYLPALNVVASAGHGAEIFSEENADRVAFDRHWLRTLSAGDITDLSIINVVGDSMEPSLFDGDQIMVDHTDKLANLRDGIYVMRFSDMLNVNPVACGQNGHAISIQSDNPAYPNWDEVPISSIDIVGRAISYGRKFN
jgi:phage repressor protein C with HTH and peptisase S24 domain